MKTKNFITILFFLILAFSIANIFARYMDPGMPGMQSGSQENRTVLDLSRSKFDDRIYLTDYAAILKNSCEKLENEPNNPELKRLTIDLAKQLAKPQPPSQIAWQTLIDHGILKEGMPKLEACEILGDPTQYLPRKKSGGMTKDNEKWPKAARWYFNYFNVHVFPCLEADVNDNTFENWRIDKR